MLTESFARGPDRPGVRDITLGQLLEEAATAVPDRKAIIVGHSDPDLQRHWTYAELRNDADRAARALLTRFEPGERVAVWAPNVPEWIILEFACAMAGVVLVTVNPSYQQSELAYVLNQSKSAGIFTLPEYRGNRLLASAEAVRSQCAALREVIRIDQWDEFMASADRAQVELPTVNPQDAVMIQYTSGTTGFPKGALLHHRGLVNNGAHTWDRAGAPQGAQWIAVMPFFHTGGCVLCVLGAVSRMATQIVVEAFEPGLVLELIETYGAHGMGAVPTMLLAMLGHPDSSRRDLSTLSAIVSGGSTVPAALVERFENELGVDFTIVFGQTECSPVASMTRSNDTTKDKAETLGGPMPGVEVKIIDPESGETLPVGQVGEYCTRGYHVMHGYFDMSEATAEAVDGDGWLHTGDLCSMDERGYCRVEGRLKDMIIRGGENIYPREIEDLLFEHPAVAEVAVVGLPDQKLGEVVGAFIRPSEKSMRRDDLYAYLREHLSPQKTPTHWIEVSEFPMTGSGKIQKFRLAEMWSAGEFAKG